MKTLASFLDIHQGSTIIVCGCGESLNQLTEPERFITIGVNDVGRRFHPEYLVVVNPREQFTGDRFSYVESSKARYLFTQLDLGLSRENVVTFSLGSEGGTDLSQPNVLHYTQNSPYVALCLAVQMGASRIGLIGVDFTSNHFFAQTGIHPLTAQLQIINEQYQRLYEAIKARGIEVFNLSLASHLTAFPKMSVEQFAEHTKPRIVAPEAGLSLADETVGSLSAEGSSSLKIVSYATTPLAGVPAILARCINARTPHRARCVWAARGYGNGVDFDGDIEWTTAPAEAAMALKTADVVIVHNGKVDAQHHALVAGKAIVTMAHNYGWNVDESFVKQGFPGVVVGQYQATLPEFQGWSVVPNPMPLWEDAFKPERKGHQVTICFTPLGQHERYPSGHKLYWHAKGWETTTRALERLASRFSIRLEVINGAQVSHGESLAMKRRSHIVIDECATGSYHRSSLEGLAAACVVVNGVGLLPGVVDALRLCAGGALRIPFVHATLDQLEDVLAPLVERGAESLAAEGSANRQWIESHWDFTRQWKQFWLPVLEQSLKHAGRAPVGVSQNAGSVESRRSIRKGVEMIESKEGVSVIISHGGRERLSHLTAMLANLRQCTAALEVIVIDMGEAPYAEETARRLADKYVFVHHVDAFQRARALNMGTPFAEYDLLLWIDNDVILPADFVEKAVAEMRVRQLDSLVPYTEVRYLSQVDSREVMAGTRNPTDCRPVNLLRSREGMSGVGALVSKAFVLQYGGFHEGFRGWGGEDNAWSYKAQLLGRSSVTQSSNQVIYHLYHQNSGGYGGNGHMANNPHYSENVALMNRIFSIRDRNEFIKSFPAPDYFSCPWTGEKRLAFIADESSPSSHEYGRRLAQVFRSLYGIEIESRRVFGADVSWRRDLLEQPPDAAVLFGSKLAEHFMADDQLAHLRSRVLVINEAAHKLTEDELDLFGTAGAIVTDEPGLAEAPQRRGSQIWVCRDAKTGSPDASSEALFLAQPLSTILGSGRSPVSVPRDKAAAIAQPGDKHPALPVWLYWEGECPDWIRRCQETIFTHAPDVSLITREDFNTIRDVDCDIDLEKLSVEHRADFVRAFLLTRFGGFWIDSDCLVMQSLQPLLNLLHGYDFIFHKERSGLVSNGFIGARPGSRIASALYQRICGVLRSGKPLGWLSLGGELLTDIIKNSAEPYYELKCELIQPICWSRPEEFFKIGDRLEHERAVNEDSIAYMLANNAMKRFLASHPGPNLLNPDTFFSYLLHKALEQNGQPALSNNHTNDAATWQQIPFCIESVVNVSPRKVLDVGLGFGRWGMLIREFLDSSHNGNPGNNGRVHLVGIAEPLKGVAEHVRFFYDRVHVGSGLDVMERTTDRWDLIILGRLSQQGLIEKALEVSDYVLVCSSAWTALKDPRCREGKLPSDLLSANVVRQAVLPDQTGGAFLLSRHDPRRLKQADPIQAVFETMIQNNVTVGEESFSGPGSSMRQTAEIRCRLPLLIADLKIRSLLDAPCGDFNWMKEVRLGIEEYIGADIVPSLVARNQERFSDQTRRFLNLNITSDYLPEVDLILCRDCLVHFPLAEVEKTLRNLKRSQSKYLLTTTFTQPRANIEIATGEWRPLNLQLFPFNFPPPLRLINEKCTEVNGAYADKCLGLWRVEDLPF